MRYWITTHWPPRIDKSGRARNTGIWIQDGKEDVASCLAKGDLVIVYEYKTGLPEVRTHPDGTSTTVGCVRGKEGVKCYGVVEGPISALPASKPQLYSDGTTKWWRWHAPVRVHSRSGFISRPCLLEAIGMKPNGYLRGFGSKNSGLKEIGKQEFDALLAKFHKAREISLPRTNGRGGGKEGGGEGPSHLNLKNYVAANPELVLGERGIETLHVEYAFPSNDQADIVMQDQHRRIVGVEIKPSVSDGELSGVLQAIKYRYMLECLTCREPGDSRAILVSHSICDSIRNKCSDYDVECFEVATNLVDDWVNSNGA